MKLARVLAGGVPRAAIVHRDTVELASGDVFGAGVAGTGAQLPIESVTWLPPVVPSKIICVARNYRAHAEELGNEVPEAPLIFFKPPSALIGHGASIVLPAGAGRVDYEGELAVVIGRRCKSVPRSGAMQVVLGYTCVNDVSARSLQRAKGHFTEAKGFDTFCPIGPWIETELDPSDRRVQTELDSVLVQDGSTALMVHDIPALIAHASAIFTLEAGDVIATGTPAGVGPMAAGSTVSVTIEGVGTLRNPVIAEPA